MPNGSIEGASRRRGGSTRSLVATSRRALLFVAASAAAACGGGGGGGSPTAPPMPVTQTVSGVTSSLAGGGCSSDSHDFMVAVGGSVQVTLNASGDAGGLKVQLCADALDNGDCTINLQTVAVGASVSGTRRGNARQVLGFRRLGCTVGPLVPGPTTYTATVTYQQ